jgi:lipopolysaccharide biosynthesis glycosyltransferase
VIAERIRIVSSANDAYAPGLAALISSVLSTAAAPARIEFILLDCGFSERTRRRLQRVVSTSGAALQFIPVDLSSLGNVNTAGHGGAAAYARLLIPSLMDARGKFIYLDADTLVLRDLEALLAHELDASETWAWAVPEIWAPFVSSPTAVFDWKEQRMDPRARYFNSGVLVFDLDIWRQHRVAERTLDYLRAHGPKVSWWDQGGLNATLYRRWRALDPRWNQTHAIFAPEIVWLDAGFDADLRERVAKDPFIVHFSGSVKPWHYGCADPRMPLFFDALSRTPWAGFRPRTPLLQTLPGRLARKIYRVGVKAPRAYAGTLIDEIAARVVPARRRASRDEQAWQRQAESLLRTLSEDLRVRSGPFTGMTFLRLPSSGHLGPMLLGAYECELQDALEELIGNAYETVVDVGCAEGYYAVGLARRLPHAAVHAFDIDPHAVALCRELAALNQVDRRVHLHGACTPEGLNTLIDKPTLLIVDCEGHEIALLDPYRAPRLRQTDMIVELHDFIDPSISTTVTARFAHTHDISIVDVQPRDPGRYPELEGWPGPVQSMVLHERRPVAPRPMQWAVLRARRTTPAR